MADPLRVLVAAPAPVLRAGVRATLEDAGYDVVAEAGSYVRLHEVVTGAAPDVCLLDAALPGDLGAGIQTLQRLVPRVAVVVLTCEHDDALLLSAVRAGATGYLVSDMDGAQLSHAVAAVATGEALIPRRFVGHLLDELRHEPGARLGTSVEPRLTERERQVLDLLRSGLPTTRIAERLYVAPVTVRTHIASIVHKLHVADREALQTRTSPARDGVRREPGGHGERPDAS